MSNNIRKLSAFRQLSLSSETCERRKTFKKQLSEDIPDWFDHEPNLKFSLNTKTRKTYCERPQPVRIAWDDNTADLKGEDVVIVKKIPEMRRNPVSKLTRHASLEKDSILSSSKSFNAEIESIKEKEKPNLQIFLAQNVELDSKEESDRKSFKPKFIPPLIVAENTKSLFSIRKTKSSPREKLKTEPLDSERSNDVELNPKPIDNIIIKPSSAASKRELFKKRTNSAFNVTVKEKASFRPPLTRSLSAPHKTDQNKSKFLATKRKVKNFKRTHTKTTTAPDDSETDKENPLSSRRVGTIGADIVTMVSLVSPAGSDNEDNIEEEKEQAKIKLKTHQASTKTVQSGGKEETELPKNTTLKKIVKQVSFQQSSIHAIRSFSASFPSRRASIATTLMFPHHKNLQKSHEKRATNVMSPDADETVPKQRRFLRNGLAENANRQKSDEGAPPEESTALNSITVNVQSKASVQKEETSKEEAEKTVQCGCKEEKVSENDVEEEDDGKPKFESVKEKVCWEMYCKMSDKGINVSYDTILRGLLTPTEYRMSRKNSISIENHC